jgi:hypothetical protein
MRKIFHLVRTERRRRRTGVNEDTGSTVIRYYSNERLPDVRGDELNQVSGETFESFQARASAVAKTSGDAFVIICISDDASAPARAVRVAKLPSFKSIEEMTDAELVVIASNQGVLHELTDAKIEALAHA